LDFLDVYGINYEFLKMKCNAHEKQPPLEMYTIGTLKKAKCTSMSWSLIEQTTLPSPKYFFHYKVEASTVDPTYRGTIFPTKVGIDFTQPKLGMCIFGLLQG